jgi:hypothetical protein
MCCKEIGIGDIGNYYGGLCIKECGKFYWGIENYDGTQYKEIPEFLYDALLRYQTEYFDEEE